MDRADLTARMTEKLHPTVDPATAAAALRERIYATTTGLSTVVVLLGYADETSAGSAATDLGLTMGSLFVASFVADLVAHSAVHGDLVPHSTLRQILRIAAQVLETALLPVLVIALAGTGIWTVRTGLVLAAVALVATQGIVAVGAVRRSTIGVGRRILIVAGELALAVLVIVIKTVTH